MTIAEFRELAEKKDLLSILRRKRELAKGEQREQIDVHIHCVENSIDMFAIPNGTYKSQRASGMFKAEGLKAGVPDLFFPIANKYYHGLFIEMKKRPKILNSGKKSFAWIKVSKEQEEWVQKLRNNGYEAKVCYGADEAIEVIDFYRCQGQ